MTHEVVQLASNGRLTLPGSIRREVGLSDGDLLRVEVSEDGRIILTPVVAVIAVRLISGHPDGKRVNRKSRKTCGLDG